MPLRGAFHVLEHRLLFYRRTYRASIFSSFLSPVMFLAAMGIGLGSYVDASGAAAAGLTAGVTYAVFLAPGLLAANAMQTAAGESTYPIMAAIEWVRQFPAMLATPITVRDIVLGQLGYLVFRLGLVAVIFVIVVVLLGAAASPAILLTIPVAILTGLAFATPISALSARLKRPEHFSLLFRFGITPMFLFSGTFFPIEQLPAAIQPVAYLTPLYHGVALSRGLALGTLDAANFAVHAGYLAALTVIGAVLFEHFLRRRLVA